MLKAIAEFLQGELYKLNAGPYARLVEELSQGRFYAALRYIEALGDFPVLIP